MSGPTPELADIFRQHGPAYRQAHSLPLYQHRLMQAIETCRTEVMGGVVEWCDHCQYTHIRYRSCRNRHCPKCQGAAREKWLQQRTAELLPTEYFHVVFTLPESIATIAFYNKEVVYDLLFAATAEALLTIAGDPQHLGVEIGFFAVLHSWGQNLHFHPHLHCIVPGGGLSADRDRWIPSRTGFFLPVKVLSRLFRRLFLEALEKTYVAGKLQFFGDLEPLRDPPAFARYLAPLKNADWVVYAKPPFGGPQQVLQYLGRYTHRVAISNRRLLALEDGQVSFQWKDYRDQQQQKVMTVSAEEFIQRFLQHSLPPRFQRIRYYGFLANCHRAAKLELCRRLLATPCTDLLPRPTDCRDLLAALTTSHLSLCPRCGVGILIRIQLFPCHGPVPLPPGHLMRPACGNFATTPALSSRQGTIPVCSRPSLLRLRPIIGTIFLAYHPRFGSLTSLHLPALPPPQLQNPIPVPTLQHRDRAKPIKEPGSTPRLVH